MLDSLCKMWFIQAVGNEAIINDYGVSFPGDENGLELNSGDSYPLCEYTKTYWIVQLKRVNFMVQELYLHF